MDNAIYSECGTYRYSFSHQWDSTRPALPICMLNRGTTAKADNPNRQHPTRRKCITVAQREGYGGITVVNLFAGRCQKSQQLRCFCDPFGPKNDAILAETAVIAKALGIPILCAWGTKGRMFDADQRALAIFKKSAVRLVCLDKTQKGYPRHPLYADLTSPLVAFA
jgi:hypothetical protein